MLKGKNKNSRMNMHMLNLYNKTMEETWACTNSSSINSITKKIVKPILKYKSKWDIK